MRKAMRNAGGKRWRTAILGVVAGSAACLLVVGCDRSEPAVTYAPRSTTEPGPTTQTIKEQAQAEPTENLAPIPDLGQAQAVNMGHDEVWSKYPSGLMMYTLRPGNGLQPQVGQTCHVYYKGTFPNGEVFDQSGKDGAGKRKAFTFVLGTKGIIKGWNMVVSTMQVGGKVKVFLPPDLAYGSHGALPKIPPNQPLIFEIELVDVTGMAVDLPATAPAEKLKAQVAGPARPTTQPAK